MSIWKCDIPMGYSWPLRRLPSINVRAFSRATFPFLPGRRAGNSDVEEGAGARRLSSEIVAVPCLRASHHRYLFRRCKTTSSPVRLASRVSSGVALDRETRGICSYLRGSIGEFAGQARPGSPRRRLFGKRGKGESGLIFPPGWTRYSEYCKLGMRSRDCVCKFFVAGVNSVRRGSGEGGPFESTGHSRLVNRG